MRVYLPWSNLGCLGVRVGRFYADVYSRRSWGKWLPGVFVCTGRARYWITPGRISVERCHD